MCPGRTGHSFVAMSPKTRQWELMGAASGLFAVLLFIAAFVIFLNTDPSGGNTPRLPNIGNAEAVPAFVGDHLNGIRAQVMLNALGLVIFLGFLGTLFSMLRRAEGGGARGAAIASAGALVGVALTMVGLVLTGTATMATTLEQAETVPTLFMAASLAYALGGGAFAVFYLGVAEVAFRAGGFPKWLGWASLLAAAASVFGFVAPYAQSGIFNPATGALGFYGHYVAFVVWLLLAGSSLTLAQRRRGKNAAASIDPEGAAS